MQLSHSIVLLLPTHWMFVLGALTGLAIRVKQTVFSAKGRGKCEVWENSRDARRGNGRFRHKNITPRRQ